MVRCICRFAKPTKPKIIFNCGHTFHVPCIRRRLRELKCMNPDETLHCPNCNTSVDNNSIYLLLNETRQYVFSKSIIKREDQFQIIIKNDIYSNLIIFESEIFNCQNFKTDPTDPECILIKKLYEFEVINPRTKFWGNIRFVDTQIYTTGWVRLSSRSLDDSSESESDLIDPTNGSKDLELTFLHHG